MRTIALIALAANAMLLLPGRVAAQEAERQQAAPKAVMELFTSQGCSSCPAADALLGKIASERKDVIAITLATDTWDYLGWKDTLSNPKFGARQRAYAKAFRDMIYTPQAVINGAAHVNGAKRAKIDAAIAGSPAMKVPVRLWEKSGRLMVETGASEEPTGRDATIWLAVISKSVSVPIERGENSGKTLTYFNVVRELTPIGMWSGKAVNVQLERSTIMRADTDACAVLIQEGQGGPILGAALLDSF